MVRIPAIIVSLALLTELLMAQSVVPDATGIDETIDEITVIGAKSLVEMRHEITLAEDRVFTLFNDFNKDDGYDIICKKQTPIGSQIPQRVCLARMYREGRSEAVADDFGEFADNKMPAAAKHQRILREKMRNLAAQHPELLQALQKRRSLVKEFEAERQRRLEE